MFAALRRLKKRLLGSSLELFRLVVSYATTFRSKTNAVYASWARTVNIALIRVEQRWAVISFYLRPVVRRYGSFVFVLSLAPLVLGTVLLGVKLQSTFGAYFDVERFAVLRNLLATMGGALIGATTIGFSIITIALQLNFARMPHGLFRKLSSDARLLSAFGVTFILAFAVSALSLLPDARWSSLMLLGTAWATAFILICFLYAYRRALTLINPSIQLRLITMEAQTDLRRWSRRAERVTPLLEDESGIGITRQTQKHDLGRLAFFQANAYWTGPSEKAIAYAVSFARRYSEQGDYDVAELAMNAIIAINSHYIAAKGQTFFATNPIFDIPHARDSFFNNTLEHLRQLAQAATARRDEHSLRQVLAGMAGLAQTYVTIDYRQHTDVKDHAHLAVGYLSNAVESTLQHGMTDVVMEGLRLMGATIRSFLAAGEANSIVAAVEKIAVLGCAGAVKLELRPVTLIAVEQLARVTFDLLRTPAREIAFATSKVREGVELIANVFLTVPDTPLSSIHSAHLAPYYSGTQLETLGSWLTTLCNAILLAETPDKPVGSVIAHLRSWAEELHRTEKVILLRSIEVKSHFTFDILHWIAHVTKLLTAVAKAGVTGEHDSRELEKHASRLISVVYWIPGDKNAIALIEPLSTTSTLFEVALDVTGRRSMEVGEQARLVLLDWTFKAGRHATGWDTLEEGLLGSAAVVLWSGDFELARWLRTEVSERLSKEHAPAEELRARAARNLRRKVVTLRQEEFEFNPIYRTLAELDRGTTRELVFEVAYLLAPETTAEPADI